MEKIQKYNQPLIPSTEGALTESKQSFECFLSVFRECGGELNDTTIRLMKDSIDKNGYTSTQIENAIKGCFNNEQFFNWANIKKYIEAKTSQTFNTF